MRLGYLFAALFCFFSVQAQGADSGDNPIVQKIRYPVALGFVNKRYPLLERLRFLAISGSNLDEFFMVLDKASSSGLVVAALSR